MFSFAEAVSQGFSRHQISRRAATGTWTRLQNGWYAVTSVFTSLPSRDQHLVRLIALLGSRPDTDVASHLSAAAVHGWSLPLDGAGGPTVTAPTASGPTRRRGGYVVQVAGLPPRDVGISFANVRQERFAVRCTHPDRTAADLLRHLRIPDSVSVVDQAVRAGGVAWEGVLRAVRRQQEWPYAARALRAMQLVDPRRESWLESYSFCTLALGGLPVPEPQVAVHDARGRFVGRVDGWWDDAAVALEPDGAAKYLLGLGKVSADTDTAAEQVAQYVRRSLVRQNERQRLLEDLGVLVVRWGTADVVQRPQALVARAAHARAGRDSRQFTGRLVRPEPWAPDGCSLRTEYEPSRSGFAGATQL